MVCKKFFQKLDILKNDDQKALKMLNLFFFQTQYFSIDKIMKNKRDLELVTNCSSGYKTSSENIFC